MLQIILHLCISFLYSFATYRKNLLGDTWDTCNFVLIYNVTMNNFIHILFHTFINALWEIFLEMGLPYLLSKYFVQIFCSVQFSYLVMSDSCNPMDCSMPSLPVHRQLLEFTQIHVHWCHQTISSSVIPFSSPLQSFPASVSFQISQFFTSSGQRIGALASASVLPKQFRVDFL